MVRRVVLTIAALVVLKLASFIPLPGMALYDLMQTTHGAVKRLSFVAIGPIAWITPVTFAELLVLLLPAHLTARITHTAHANPFAWPIVAFACATAALQGYGIAVAMEHVPRLVVEPGIWFQTVTCVSLVAGTSLAGRRMEHYRRRPF